MKISILLVLIGFTVVLATSRSKRAAYDLPDGIEVLFGTVRTSFVCSQDGYYADQDNNCQIFHVCHTVINSDGTQEILQWSFMCGNQTVFNQFSFTCSYPEDAVPCASASDLFYLNANLGAGPNVYFHNEQEIVIPTGVTRRPPISQPPDEQIYGYPGKIIPPNVIREVLKKIKKPSIG